MQQNAGEDKCRRAKPSEDTAETREGMAGREGNGFYWTWRTDNKGCRVASECKRRQANASEGKRMQAKASECKRMQAKASECSKMQVKTNAGERRQTKARNASEFKRRQANGAKNVVTSP
jgi:hypothetical protein